jgi:hypothetical protein
MLLTCVREVLSSNFGRDIDYADFEGFCGLPQPLQANVGIVPSLSLNKILYCNLRNNFCCRTS